MFAANALPYKKHLLTLKCYCMKRQNHSFRILSFLFCSMLCSGSGLLASPATLKAGNYRAADTLTADQPIVSFNGSDEDYYYFRVKVANPEGLRSEIILRDKSNGTVLYSSSFTSGFEKHIAVPKDITLLQWDIQKKAGKGHPYRNSMSFTTEVKHREDIYVSRL